jgi:coenzyme F420-reducing hydrogenase beta subunit
MPELFGAKHECCGCSACLCVCPSSAISMQEDEEGFLYPQIDAARCTECGLCTDVCVFKHRINVPITGASPDVYAAKHSCDAVRLASSSGGLFSALAEHFLQYGGVIYGAAYDNNIVCRHIRADNADEAARCRGSKYVQSEMSDIFTLVKRDLKNGRRVLFSGTPCQVDGLCSFLGALKNSPLLLTADLVCHGVPSPKLFAAFISFFEKKRGQPIIEYHNRSKKKGWGHTEEAVFSDGMADYSSILSQAWKFLFYSHLALRPSCHVCPYTSVARCSDITLADFWGAKKNIPDFADDMGVSLLLLNTPKAVDLMQELKASVLLRESSVANCIDMQGSLRRPAPVDAAKRSKFWSDYNSRGIEFVLKRYARYNMCGSFKAYMTDKERSFAPIVEYLAKLKRKIRL